VIANNVTIINFCTDREQQRLKIRHLHIKCKKAVIGFYKITQGCRA